ncbi:MAG: hypothetical protein A3G35_04495 [candidate division NC10 bacterium RIFCSPLOWO2_12_FULL_66_18]|nr:MAG: hypothetical protein A3H39_02685 [candidate division NC10 bacterium RIFCSPLOWO2_02_FULL_66_22]OGB95944.1 MAG: hypothetical protein A3G35_04495 [candidate division NC10 bacterium RIFCSPLOWO2_12_FULL_66_18]
MTNTLHRFGSRDSLRDDYIIFAMAARGINDQGAPPKLQTFLRLALKHHPINVGNAVKGGIFRASKALTPLAHWRRREFIAPEEVVESIDTCTTVSAVFDDPANLEAFLTELRGADLGISINIAALTDEARTCCQRAGITRHSVEYSLGFHGDLNRLPDRHVLELSTMCGHGMVAHNLAKKMLDWVKEGRRDPRQAATYLAKFCTCGIYNTTRAIRVLEEARVGK